MTEMRDRTSEIRVNVFPGGFNWALYIGIEKELFSQRGLAVTVLGTPNSVTQMTELSQGTFEIAMTAVDNIVAYVEGQGEAPIGPQPEFFAFMGSDSGFLSLVASPDIMKIADFAGKTLSVDALTTGYAFVLYDILRRNGLDQGAYQLKRVGGMIQRFNSLLQRNEHGTLLSAPYNLSAKNQGLVELVKATAVLGPYQGNVAATRQSWAKSHGAEIVAFIRGYHEAITWLYQPANRSEAVAILLRNLPNMPQEMADASYTELLDPRDGFFRDCKIDLRGLACVLDLRSRYGEPKKQLNDPLKYCDLSYFEQAMK
jgi:ABC-type nitrate/sulfonate/bicarbonate transport system substrate-binding protein